MKLEVSHPQDLERGLSVPLAPAVARVPRSGLRRKRGGRAGGVACPARPPSLVQHVGYPSGVTRLGLLRQQLRVRQQQRRTRALRAFSLRERGLKWHEMADHMVYGDAGRGRTVRTKGLVKGLFL